MRRSLLENNQKKPRNRGFTIVGLIVLVAIYIATLIVVQQSRLAFGAVSLQAITALNITLILVMLFVLGRNIIKLYVERRRQKLGSQFRMRSSESARAGFKPWPLSLGYVSVFDRETRQRAQTTFSITTATETKTCECGGDIPPRKIPHFLGTPLNKSSNLLLSLNT